MLPISKLDDKTFSELVEEARKTIPRYTKEWTDQNIHDPGVTFFELFSWLAEIQHFYLDRIQKENYLKFLKLIGIEPMEAKSARADVTFSLSEPISGGILIPKGTKLLTGQIVFTTEEKILVVPVRLEKIYTSLPSGVLDNTVVSSIAGQHFYAFGEEPVSGSRMYLGFDQSFPEGETIPITFNLFEKYPVAKGKNGDEKHIVVPSVCLSWEYWSEGKWAPLTIINDETLMLSKSGSVTFLAPNDMKKGKVHSATDTVRFWFRATVMQAGYELPPRIESILLNTISVIQRDKHSEKLGCSNGFPGQSYQLQQFPIVPKSLVLQVEERTGGTLQWREWIRVNDFDASKPSDRHYTLKAETGQIFFGDGVNGAIPPVPEEEGKINIRACTYQTTVGEKGNVGPRTIIQIYDYFEGAEKISVENRLPASGGAPMETLDEAKSRARREWKTKYSAVTSEDFEYLAVSTPGLRVARVKAIPLIGPPDFTSEREASVTIVVVPYSEAPKPMPSKGFLQTVRCHLDKHRLITTQLHVIAPDYVQLRVEALVSIKPDYHSIETRNRIDTALQDFFHPLKGGPEGGGWPIGRTVYKSEVYEKIGKVDGVGCVQSVRLIGEGKGVIHNDGNVQIRPIAMVFSGEHRIEITP
ncbi:putative baseplate assembly protein [Bacillus pseudomycoides]|uniref:putative baseplate assembly protein n=1 Tax=Bacillus pseudomycoides TaxID=64104 RepID=UPI000BEC18EA|nr:putative baseplate assembly protein [Bacillus pseudomycoides]MBD5799844.1 putative baseplate assembly protein [Bacillus pseudomycoides]MED1476534.1 putative baseplate assembly protein [Bacillus pseudomycoides]PDZ13453.1 putative baseplate assembly protein [Bacillus pseudomycoides]PEO78119.1 putative baseplate assembly protein [Bacillus pseudomycoides]